MTVEEVAKYLKMKPQTIYKWANEGQIPGTRLGKEWRFRKRFLDEWIDRSIILSEGGFNFMTEGTFAETLRSGLSEEEMDRLIRESMQ